MHELKRGYLWGEHFNYLPAGTEPSTQMEWGRQLRAMEIRHSYNIWCGEQRRADYLGDLCTKAQESVDFKVSFK